MSPDPSIEILRPLHAQLHYHVLAHLDLGRDAANLHDPRLPWRWWARPLLGVYRAAPGRLLLQGLPLWCDSLDGLLQMLEGPRLDRQLGDEAGRLLRKRFARALRRERRTVERRQGPGTAPGPLLEDLRRLRSALYEDTGQPAPPLQILDCPALGTPGGWSHGRAGTVGGRRVVAVSLEVDWQRALVQILHEEIHPVTDPAVRARFRDLEQDTRADSEGYALHAALERENVAHGQRLLERHAPELLDCYGAWRARYSG